MSKFNLARMTKNVQRTAVKHGPEILTGIGIAGMLTTVGLAVTATPKALKLIEEAEAVEKVDVVKACWKCYIPAAVTGTASIACLIGASSVNARRTAAITAAYKMTETALSDYRDKVVETIGEKKEKTVRDKVAQKKLDENPVEKAEVIITGDGESLCYDPLSDRYFKSNIDKIHRAMNKLNTRMIQDITGYASVNDFYDEVGLHHTGLGDVLGWNTDYQIEIDIGSHVTTDGRPCIVVDHTNPPKYDYY